MKPTLTKNNYAFNLHGGLYAEGCSFEERKWVEIIIKYKTELRSKGKCTIRHLANICFISKNSAEKAIKMAKANKIDVQKHGTPLRGIGSLKGLTYEHHRFIYDLYLANPTRGREEYIQELHKEYNIGVSVEFMSKWFHGMGPFRGAFRRTSIFPSAKNTPRVLQLVIDYLNLISRIVDHSKIVFADEKPMKQKDLFGLVRRDPFTGEVPHQNSNAANKRIRYNIFAAVTVKLHATRNIEFVVLEETGDAFLFRAFVMHLLEEGTLEEGDVFVVDNCTIHFNGENKELKEMLWREFDILMLALPPYHPELNPTEFVFAHLLVELRKKNARLAIAEEAFLECIEDTIDELGYSSVVNEYLHCGYLKNKDHNY